MLHTTFHMPHATRVRGHSEVPQKDDRRIEAKSERRRREKDNSTEDGTPDIQSKCRSDKTRAGMSLGQQQKGEPWPTPYHLCTETPGDGR